MQRAVKCPPPALLLRAKNGSEELAGHTYSRSSEYCEYSQYSQHGRYFNVCRAYSTVKHLRIYCQHFQQYFACLRLRLRIWSRETGSAVPSHVSPLNLDTRAEYGAYSGDFSRFPRRSSYTVNRHWVGPGFIRSCRFAPIVFTTESTSTQGQ